MIYRTKSLALFSFLLIQNLSSMDFSSITQAVEHLINVVLNQCIPEGKNVIQEEENTTLNTKILEKDDESLDDFIERTKPKHTYVSEIRHEIKEITYPHKRSIELLTIINQKTKQKKSTQLPYQSHNLHGQFSPSKTMVIASCAVAPKPDEQSLLISKPNQPILIIYDLSSEAKKIWRCSEQPKKLALSSHGDLYAETIDQTLFIKNLKTNRTLYIKKHHSIKDLLHIDFNQQGTQLITWNKDESYEIIDI